MAHGEPDPVTIPEGRETARVGLGEVAPPHRPHEGGAVQAPSAFEVWNHRGAEQEDEFVTPSSDLFWKDAADAHPVGAPELP